KADDPAETDAAPSHDAAVDGAGIDAPSDAPDAAPADANPACAPLATDYQPRVNGSGDDAWPACISDDNAYHRFADSISSIARVAAFEAIRDLFTSGGLTAQDFVDADFIYLQDQGLDSRVGRREDEHYPAATDVDGTAVACNSGLVDPADFPERCVGPARIQPLLLAAFAAGGAGEALRINAARIEAGLLWFLYVSIHKEATTCTANTADCDSGYAYYTGGEAREAGLGLAHDLRVLDPTAHDRVWDGLLSVRCWRDLDQAIPAADLARRDQEIRQLDVALLRGIAVLVSVRTVELMGASGEDRAALWASLQILGAVLGREASERDPTAAATLAAELARADPDAVDA
ncbi:MAG: hypothetical protein AAB131_05020, partial [Actinomycetota bacterium]